MKKVIRSPFLKGVAFALCLVCVAVASVRACGTLEWFITQSDERGVYLFEDNFEQSRMLNNELNAAAVLLNDALWGQYDQQNVITLLQESYCGDYYAKLGNVELKNAQLTETEAYASPYYLVIKPEQVQGNVRFFDSYQFANWDSRYMMYYSGSDELVQQFEAQRNSLQSGDCILLRLTQDQVDTLEQQWLSDRDVIFGAVRQLVILILVALAAFVYLLFVTGRKAEDEQVHLLLIDRMFAEVNLLVLAGVVIGTIAVVFAGLENCGSGDMSISLLVYPLTLLLVLAFALVMTLLLSLVRNLKNRTFVERSFVLSAVRWCWRTAKRICRWFMDKCRSVWHGAGRGKDSLWHKVFQNYDMRKVFLLFVGYSAVLAMFATLFGMMFVYGGGVPFLLAVAWVAVSAAFLFKRIDGFDRVVDALKRLRGGELTYKLTDMPAGVFAAMADDINSLGDGMQLALQNEVRAERMKSELITNVSHDLKTPLTSILNYSDLLCQEHLTPEEANDYAKIIYQKGMRLKNLTSDLFDISKVQSGAEQMVCERLDACTLVRQALGEQDKAIGDGRLTFKVDMPEHEVPVWADGKKMSRVMENLIGNCVKYAMPGTRVFVSVAERDGSAVIELKNIANYAMDFDASEITERFVRGDAARSTEGSGLGLAIAKSYVEACGGSFAVAVDGDLFKVLITFAIQP